MGRVARSLRARRSVSKPEMPGMRTSEIIIPTSSVRSSSNACSPEGARTVSKPCPLKNELSRLRWVASSSTMRMRGALRGFFAASAGMSSVFGHQLEVSDSEDCALRLIGQALNLPAMSQHNLLHDSQAEAGPFFVGGDIRFEDFQALAGRHSRSIVPNFQGTFGSASSAANDLDFTARIHGLSGVEQKVEQRLPKQLLIGLDREVIAGNLELDVFLLDVVIQGAHNFANDRTETDRGAAHLARTRKVDELIQLGCDAIGFIDNFERFCPNFGQSFLLLGNHLRQAANDIERVARFMGQSGGGQIHLLEVRVQLAGPQQTHLQLRGAAKITPGQGQADHGNGCETANDHAHPEILMAGPEEVFRRHANGQAVQASGLKQGPIFLLAHPGRAPTAWPFGSVRG